MKTKRHNDAPDYVNNLADKLEPLLPPGTQFVIVCQAEDDSTPYIITTIVNTETLAASLRRVARNLAADA